MSKADTGLNAESSEPGFQAVAFLLVVLAAFALLSCESGSLPAPESSYREELRNYNDQIAQQKRHIESFRSLTETYNTMPEQARRESFKDPNESLRRAQEEYSSLLRKREDLKSKVVRKYGRLPEWWTEPY